MSSHAFRRALGPGAALLLAAGCAAGPVEWEAARLHASADDSLAPAAADAAPAPLAAGGCPGLVRVAAAGATRFAASWVPRADGSGRATLVVARSDDGGTTWGEPVPVDTLDRGTRGCERPAASVAYDPAGGYVHVAYFLDAPEGPGLFFAHSMDRGRLFHEPVAIVYGERAVDASVAADHDTVAVAYVDPNSARGRVLLALSRTAGHIFEQKAVPVSGSDGAAAAPTVTVRGRTVSVAWREGAGVVERRGVLR